jgi:hypothetical protein
MISFTNLADGIVLIKFCSNLNELENFQMNSFYESESTSEDQEIKSDDDLHSTCYKTETKQFESPKLNHILFMIKMESINCSFPAQDAIKISLKKNISNLADIWYITLLYVRN